MFYIIKCFLCHVGHKKTDPWKRNEQVIYHVRTVSCLLAQRLETGKKLAGQRGLNKKQDCHMVISDSLIPWESVFVMVGQR